MLIYNYFKCIENIRFYCIYKSKSNSVQYSFCHLEAIFVISWSSWSQFSSTSWSRPLCFLISPPNTAAQCLLTCSVLGTRTFTTNRWLASEGKQMADLIRNQRHCLMEKITGRWGQLPKNGPVEGLRGRWLLTDGSLQVQEESNQVGEENGNVGGRWRRAVPLLPGVWKSGIRSAWLSVRIHIYSVLKLGWCNAPLLLMWD